MLRGPAEMSTTDMFTFSASGLMCLPMVIHPYQRIPCEITKTVPDDWGLGHSRTGWITADVFHEYTGPIAPRLGKHNVKFPLILSSDITRDDSEEP